MDNKALIETTKDIVVAMINSKMLTTSSKGETNKVVLESITEIYNKLVDINSKSISVGKSIPTIR